MVALAVAVAIAAPVAQAKKAAPKVLTVCKHGCVYTTIQKAVNAAGRKATIKVKPGKYVEGVIVSGHKYDGLHIIGVGKKPSDVVLEGRHARGPGGAAQNGIDGENVNNLDLENFKAEHFAANGVFINTCHGYLMKNLVAGFNHSYGLYVFKCVGGRMTKSVGYGNGDSAFYVGGTPFEKHPVTTTLDHLTGYENVLGYSGTNSKYILIRDSEFYNNGAGVVPNTLASEPDEPATSGVIEHNLIYWNNFDYYRPNSPVLDRLRRCRIQARQLPDRRRSDPVRHHRLGGQEQLDLRQLPVGRRGVLGSRRTRPGRPRTTTTKFIDNKMGAPFKDANGFDFYNDGSGKGTCFEDNGAGVTFDTSATEPTSQLYPSCPSNNGTGTTTADPTQFGKLAAIVLADPPTTQENYWHVHKHPKRKGRTPFEG